MRPSHFLTSVPSLASRSICSLRIVSMVSRASNIVLLPTYFSGRASDNDYLIGEDRALDLDRYCIVVPSLFGNGVSSSPSNAPALWSRSRFPRLTYFDNVAAQHALLTQVFGAKQLQAVIGSSMGAMQAWQWATQYSSMVRRVVAICGTARTAEHKQLFLDGVRAALTADGNFSAGEYDTPPIKGLEAFSIVYAGWFASQRFFADRRYREAGINDLAGLVAFAKQVFMSHDANDLLAMAATWRAGDPGANNAYGGISRRPRVASRRAHWSCLAIRIFTFESAIARPKWRC